MGAKRRRQDPYALAQARQRKTANLARRAVLQKQREAALGNPVVGPVTPFIRSLAHIASGNARYLGKVAAAASSSSSPSAPSSSSSSSNSPLAPSNKQSSAKSPGSTPRLVLNHAVDPSELEEALKHGHFLTEPAVGLDRNVDDPMERQLKRQRHQQLHQNAAAAMARIISLANGNNFDLKRVQRQRCVDTFGRHMTDQHLPPKPPPNIPSQPQALARKTLRAGPDTGSPEVQIAILTLRIRSLAGHLSGAGRTDMINKRTLRLLVHKRQKLMRYLRRKDRGASRWQHVTEKMGLSDAMWKGEISLP
ncbi:MAG: hypothetical protein M1815_000623 [Lichina confinis]|nr:MAG: hypothetical protein M1815_000623 [Lichina confinis]